MSRSQVLVVTPLVASLLCSWLPGVIAQGEDTCTAIIVIWRICESVLCHTDSFSVVPAVVGSIMGLMVCGAFGLMFTVMCCVFYVIAKRARSPPSSVTPGIPPPPPQPTQTYTYTGYDPPSPPVVASAPPPPSGAAYPPGPPTLGFDSPYPTAEPPPYPGQAF